MSRICELTGTKPFYGNNVSHSNIKTRTRWLPNLKNKKYLIPELGQILRLTLCARAIKTIDKVGGITAAIYNVKEEKLSPSLLKVKRSLERQKRKQHSNKK
jgi:large subunit ribosomal protein L28